MASYHRCRLNDQFFDRFYDLLLSKSHAVKMKFAGTDFTHLKLMLREALLVMLCFESGVDGTREEIERLGRRHKEMGITPEMYSLWLDSLCEAIRLHDSQCTDELEQHWRRAIQSGIDLMISMEDASGRDDD
jgi:hemoglobin-like flavoprotein